MSTSTVRPMGAARRAIAGLALAAGAIGLTGCASVYLVDNQVQSFARWSDATAPAGALPQPPQRYRFERLPSQREGAAAKAQDALESLAQAALAKLGWTGAEPGVQPSPQWAVQVSVNALRLPRPPWENPWPHPWGGWGGFPGRDYVVTGSGQVIWTPMFMNLDPPYYQREVSVVVRQAATGRVVYETRAAHDGIWPDSPAIWGAMLDAALQGFPQAPAGTRQVNLEVPR